MNATREDDGDRERVRVVEFWRAVEIFSPQPLPRPDARFRVADVGPGEPMPWEPDSRHDTPPAPGKAWRHEVFGGVYELSRVRDTLTGLYGPDADGGQREPAAASRLSSRARSTGTVYSRGAPRCSRRAPGR